MEKKRTMSALVASFAMIGVLRAATVYTTDNTDFFNCPVDTAHYVSSAQTPGSANFYPHAEVTVVDAGALYACFNGLLERKYHFSKGMADSWDVTEYGPKTLIGFWFDSNALFGDRATPYSKGVIGRSRMLEFASHSSLSSFRQHRPSWTCDLWAIGSSRATLAGGARLDVGDMPTFDWAEIETDGTEEPSGCVTLGDLCREKMLLVENLGKTPQSSSSVIEQCEGFLTRTIEMIGYGNPYTQFYTENQNVWHTSYPQAASNFFGRAGVDVSNVFSVPDPMPLQKAQPWMTAACQYLAPLDRVYTASSARGSTNNEHHVCGTYRNSSISLVAVSATRDRGTDEITISPTITVGMNSWSVGTQYSYDAITNMQSVEISHPRRIDISGTSLPSHQLRLPWNVNNTTEFTCGQFRADFGGYLIIGTNTVRIIFEAATEMGRSSDILYYQINRADVRNAIQTGDSFPNTPILIQCRTEKDYTYDRYTRNVQPVSGQFRPITSPVTQSRYSTVCSYLINSDSGIPSGQGWFDDDIVLGFKTTSGVGGDASTLQGLLDDAVDDLGAAMVDRAVIAFGDFTTPGTYAEILPDECKCSGTISKGTFGLNISNDYFSVIYNGTGLSDMTLLSVDDPEYREMVCEGPLESDFVMYATSECIVPQLDDTEWSASSTTNAAHSCYGDAAIIQRRDFKFDSIHVSGEDFSAGAIVGPTEGQD